MDTNSKKLHSSISRVSKVI